MAARFLIGTSGWIYPHWRGRFYPPRLPPSRWLEFLSGRLPSVEVNATFYSLTTPRACERWRASVPSDFVFALKGSRYITHMKQLRDARAALANFFASGILRLGAQMGPILWQLPPRLRFRADVAEEFFSLLPRDVRSAEHIARRHDRRVSGRSALAAPDGRGRRLLHAVEPRHESWMGEEASSLLRAQGIALVFADTAGLHPSPTESTTDSLAYVRLHGARRIYEGRYRTGELEEWATRVRAWTRQDTPVFVYFDNDRGAAAPRDALRLASLVAGKGDPERGLAAVPEREGRARRSPSHFAFRSGVRRKGPETRA